MTSQPATRPSTLPAAEDACWAAVVSRDPAWDGLVVYGVTSTGIYCRPSCPSRRPSRDHVRFFATPQDAEAAGFRTCRRCLPGEPERSHGERRAVDAASYIEAHLDERITLADLAAQVGLSASHLQRSFTRRFGCSPRQYQAALRTGELKRRLRDGEPVAEATYGAGFGSSRAAYEAAERGIGMPPGRYRRGGAGTTVRYTVLPSPLGSVLVGATDRGVCAVLLDDDESAAITDLAAEFPNAALVRDDDAVGERARQVVAYASGEATRPSIPLDLRGTEFQLRVWTALQQLPEGATASYGDIAESIGEPSAVRAVAGACASNHVSILVPCHRVVRRDGGLGGYKWGVERKRHLLEQERARRR